MRVKPFIAASKKKHTLNQNRFCLLAWREWPIRQNTRENERGKRENERTRERENKRERENERERRMNGQMNGQMNAPMAYSPGVQKMQGR
jgi:hypothetical protein